MAEDILREALDKTNIGYLNVTAEVYGKELSAEQKKYAIDKRLDPKIYFRQLVDKPGELLEVMTENKVILSGSRAAGYFNPSACTESSDWDFYIVNNPRKVYAFILYLDSIGIKIVSLQTRNTNANTMRNVRRSHEPTEIEYFRPSYVKCVLTMKSTFRNGCTVQLIILNSPTCLDAVCSFDMSAVQCIISGWCAVSMYYKLLKENKTIWWTKPILSMHSTLHDSADRSSTVRRHEKYTERGFTTISYFEYLEQAEDIPHSMTTFGKLRSIADSQCHVINFLPTEENKLKYNKLKYYSWIDKNQHVSSTSPLGNFTIIAEYYTKEFKESIDSLIERVKYIIKESDIESDEKENIVSFMLEISQYIMFSECDF